MCLCTTESLWWRRLPPAAQRGVGSPPPPPLLHPLPPLLPLAQKTSFIAGQKWSFFHSHTPSLIGRALRCFPMSWRKGCSYGWRLMAYMQSVYARAEYTGKDLWLHTWISPTNWRRSSHANCLTPSNSFLVSITICSHTQVWTQLEETPFVYVAVSIPAITTIYGAANDSVWFRLCYSLPF